MKLLKTFIFFIVFSNILFAENSDNVHDKNIELCYEEITVGDDIVLNIFNSDRSEHLYSFKHIVKSSKLTVDKKVIFFLVDYITNKGLYPLWKYDSKTKTGRKIGYAIPGFQISRDNKYLISLNYKNNYYSSSIYCIDTFKKIKSYDSKVIIWKILDKEIPPKYFGLSMKSNYAENGVDVFYNHYDEYGPDSFTIFISFDDFSYRYTDRLDLFSR